MMGKSGIDVFIESSKESLLKTVRELCMIPAPSHCEHKRAEYCKAWLEDIGAQGVYIDGALNVIFPFKCDGKSDITVFAAHTDTVFPDREPMPYREDAEKIYCPGAADDTASVAVLLAMARFFAQKGIVPSGGILFVCNSCEEGLGNLKGTRQIFKDYEGRIGRFISFDSVLDSVVDRCVGSCRYEVEVKTEGGHSYGSFGNENAIARLAKIISRIYEIEVPVKEGARVTYNVGTVEGGTSVNTIAQSAKMLCEYRSDDFECLCYMKTRFEEIFREAQDEKCEVLVRLVGERPCGITEKEKIEELKDKIIPIIQEVTGETVSAHSGSTDCNIPLSLGVAALCIGVDRHGGVHTREEWLDKASLKAGLEIAIRTALALTQE